MYKKVAFTGKIKESSGEGAVEQIAEINIRNADDSHMELDKADPLELRVTPGSVHHFVLGNTTKTTMKEGQSSQLQHAFGAYPRQQKVPLLQDVSAYDEWDNPCTEKLKSIQLSSDPPGLKLPAFDKSGKVNKAKFKHGGALPKQGPFNRPYKIKMKVQVANNEKDENTVHFFTFNPKSHSYIDQLTLLECPENVVAGEAAFDSETVLKARVQVSSAAADFSHVVGLVKLSAKPNNSASWSEPFDIMDERVLAFDKDTCEYEFTFKVDDYDGRLDDLEIAEKVSAKYALKLLVQKDNITRQSARSSAPRSMSVKPGPVFAYSVYNGTDWLPIDEGRELRVGILDACDLTIREVDAYGNACEGGQNMPATLKVPIADEGSFPTVYFSSQSQSQQSNEGRELTCDWPLDTAIRMNAFFFGDTKGSFDLTLSHVQAKFADVRLSFTLDSPEIQLCTKQIKETRKNLKTYWSTLPNTDEDCDPEDMLDALQARRVQNGKDLVRMERDRKSFANKEKIDQVHGKLRTHFEDSDDTLRGLLWRYCKEDIKEKEPDMNLGDDILIASVLEAIAAGVVGPLLNVAVVPDLAAGKSKPAAIIANPDDEVDYLFDESELKKDAKNHGFVCFSRNICLLASFAIDGLQDDPDLDRADRCERAISFTEKVFGDEIVLDTIENAQKLLKKYPGIPLISLDGYSITRDGLLQRWDQGGGAARSGEPATEQIDAMSFHESNADDSRAAVIMELDMNFAIVASEPSAEPPDKDELKAIQDEKGRLAEAYAQIEPFVMELENLHVKLGKLQNTAETPIKQQPVQQTPQSARKRARTSNRSNGKAADKRSRRSTEADEGDRGGSSTGARATRAGKRLKESTQDSTDGAGPAEE